MDNGLRHRLRTAINQIPTVDIHSHIDYRHPAATDVNDIVFYHYIVSELAAAGMPTNHLSSDQSPRERLQAALPYLPRIANTSTYWGLQQIVRDLYHLDGPLTEASWLTLCERIEEHATDPARVRQILQDHAHIRRTFLTFPWDAEWDGVDDRFFVPTVRVEPLVSRPWNNALLQTLEQRSQRTIYTAADVHEALQHIASEWQRRGVIAIAASFERDHTWDWRAPSPRRVDAALRALRRGEHLTDIEVDELNVFALRSLLTACEALHLPVQLMLGIRGLATGLRLPTTQTDILIALATLFADFPNVCFDVILANPVQSHELAAYAKMHPNVWVAGYWWYALYPSVIRRMLRERLEMLPGNKINGFFSDAYCVEWSYAKVQIVRRQIAEVLSDMVEEGYLEEEQAVTLAEQLLNHNPGHLYLKET